MPVRVKFVTGAITLVAVGLLIAGCVVGLWQRSAADVAVADPAGTDDRWDSAATPNAAGGQGTGTSGPKGAAAINDSWLNRQAGVTGVPRRVLLAYVAGANWANKKWSDCNIDWSTLAGVGYVESHHGTIDGTRVHPDGVARPRIVGVQLDGVKTATIADTDAGKYDGDPRYDRAVGPMQFIPGSWTKFAVDGNKDGAKNPQQIDDAAFTTARYLCAQGANLAATAAWQQAIRSYNNSQEYVNRVSTAARTIARNSRAAG